MGCSSFLQGIFPTQGSNPCLPHSRWILYCLSHKGSPPPREAMVKCQMLPLDCQTQWPWFFTFLPCPREKSFSFLKLPILLLHPLGRACCIFSDSISSSEHLSANTPGPGLLSLHRPYVRELLFGDDTTSYVNLALPSPILLVAMLAFSVLYMVFILCTDILLLFYHYFCI